MQRFISFLVMAGLAAASGGAATAGKLENDVRGLWLGAWVVFEVEATSDCGTNYTNNRVNANLVRGSGRHKFAVGELAKIDKLDIKRSRIDLLLTLAEPILVPYTEGPFTLYRETRCKVELEVEIPREVVKAKDAGPIEDTLVMILERHATTDAARASDRWNERERDDYPEDYELTLAKLAVWRAEQTNDAVQAKLDDARSKTFRIPDRVSADPEYLNGFARGIESARKANTASCSALLAIDIDNPPGRLPSDDEATGDREGVERGFRDGKQFVFGMEMLQRLPDCFVPVPELPAVAQHDAAPSPAAGD